MSALFEILSILLGLILVKYIDNTMIAQNEELEEQKAPEKTPVTVYVENMNGIYYAWEDNTKFLFQHEDPDEMAKKLIRRYPKHNLTINETTS